MVCTLCNGQQSNEPLADLKTSTRWLHNNGSIMDIIISTSYKTVAYKVLLQWLGTFFDSFRIAIAPQSFALKSP